MILVASGQSVSGNKDSEHGSLFLMVLLAFLLTACAPVDSSRSVVLSGPTMGTEFRITVVLEPGMEQDGLLQLVQRTLDATEQKMSTYIPESEVSQFNSGPADVPQALSSQTAEVVAQALQISRQTGGYFDITVGPLVNAWGFGPGGQTEKEPTPEQLAGIRQAIGYNLLELQGAELTKSHHDVQVDLSAIAKGYVVDQLADLLRAQGISHFLINVGGELRAAGQNIDKQAWRVGIEKPALLGGVATIVELHNQAIATSGDYRNYVVIDGHKYSHTIDPLLQIPVMHNLALVSVISDKTSTADALATAMLAMGEKKAQEFARREKIAAYMVIREGQEGLHQIKITPEFMANLQ